MLVCFVTAAASGASLVANGSPSCDASERNSASAIVKFSRSELEGYKVTWNADGCWQAAENCVSAADSSGHLSPPPVPVYLRGCISAAAR
jgi:hypothetical protein